MAVNRARPGWFTLPTRYGERIRRQPYQVGIELKRVLFADHRSGWSGLRLYVYCLWWSWRWTVACWRNGPPDAPQEVITLRQQVEATHGDRWAAYDAQLAEAKAREREYVARLQAAIDNELKDRDTSATDSLPDVSSAG